MSTNQTLVYEYRAQHIAIVMNVLSFRWNKQMNSNWTYASYRFTVTISHFSGRWVHACITYIDIQNSYIFTVCYKQNVMHTNTRVSFTIGSIDVQTEKFCLQNGKKNELCCVKFASLRLHSSQVTTKYLHNTKKPQPNQADFECFQ